jgi:phenylpropionate dioxygenase-like ring-hydroxylating dioxygenase large terminal subunit
MVDIETRHDVAPETRPVSVRTVPRHTVLRDAWFPLARTRLLRRDRPIQRMLDGSPIVIWRDGQGVVRAMDDRCAHRRASLSSGRVVDGTLQCPYHGWRYDGTGAVVKIPSLTPGERISPHFCVDDHPVVVRYGWIWVWWGDAAAADPAYLPDIPFLDPAGDPPGGRLTRFTYRAPQELVVENLLDLTHLDFVHGAIFGDPYGAGEEQILVDHTDEVITMTRLAEQRLPPKAQAFLTRGKRQDLHQTMQIHVRSGVAVGVAWSTPPGWGICLFLPNVPAGPEATYQEGYLKLIGPAWYSKYVMPWASRIVTWQDARIFRGQVPNYRNDDGRADKSVPADVAGLRYRSMRRALVDRQAAGDFAYAPGWQGPDAATVHRVERLG